jgi:hypothetical protein
METEDSRKVGGAEKGLEFKGSSRALMRCFWKNIFFFFFFDKSE